MASAPIILVPGFWLGAWAWDDDVSALRAHGHDVTAVTLSDHVDAICEAVTAAGAPVVLAVHSGAGVPGYAASDRVPEQLAAMVYVDSGPAKAALDPGFDAAEMPLPSWQQLEEGGSSLAGLNEEQLETFRRRAVPEPGGAVREAPELVNHRRLDVPSTVICTSLTSEQIKEGVKQGYEWLAGLAELRDVTYVDLSTGHWPMWSRPKELAAVIGDVARRASQ